MLAEMVATEREYVRALDYTVENYFPELDRPDVPQGLRGQRAHLFGNLEKLRDFHCHFFLRELEACTQHPSRVAYAFLRHVSLPQATWLLADSATQQRAPGCRLGARLCAGYSYERDQQGPCPSKCSCFSRRDIKV